MVAAIDSKPIAVWRAGSIPTVGTKPTGRFPGNNKHAPGFRGF